MTGVVEDREGTAHYILSGTWDDKMESSKIVDSSQGCGGSEGKQKTVYQTLQPKLLWKKYPLPYVYYKELFNLFVICLILFLLPFCLTFCPNELYLLPLYFAEITQRTCTFSPPWL